MQSPPDPAAVTAAVQALARLERLNLNPGARPPDAVEPQDTPSTVLQAAGPAALAEIEAAIAGATGTGRVALAMAAQRIDRERGARIVAQLRDDRSEAWVDTCIVGFRSVAQWARMQGPFEPAPTTRDVGPRSAGGWIAWLAIAGAIALLWLIASR